MRSSFYRKITYFLVFLFLFVLSINLSSLIVNTGQDSIKIESHGTPHSSVIVPYNNILWNPNQTNPWYPTIEGDPSDVSAFESPNQANFVVIGNSGKYVFAETPDETWNVTSDPEWGPLPNLAVYNNNYSTDKYGAFLTYTWDEDGAGAQLGQLSSVQWKKNIPNVPVNMSDYIITSASLKVMFNATVQATNHDGGGIDCLDDPISQMDGGDFVRFYIRLSDPNNNTRIPQASNKSRYLGLDTRADGDGKDHFPNSILSSSESRLIGDLESLFELNHTSLTILIGMNIFCEDNDFAFDHDYWEKLRIKHVNLTFTYEKRIDQITAVSWNQDLNAVNRTQINSTIQITDANLNFKFKIDQNWTEASQNSHIRIFIDDRKYPLPIPLIDYIYSPSFQEAQIGGFDIVSKILPYEEFTLSIQVNLAEDFGLDHNITISITDVELYITYTETIPDPLIPPIPEPWIFLALLVLVTAAAVCLGGYFIAYQRILKYPRPIRKVRKFRRTLNKSTAPDIRIMPRDIAFKKSYNKELGASSKLLRLKPSESKGAEAIEKGELAKLTDKTLGKKIDSDKLINQSLEKKGELDKLVDKLPEKPDS